MADVPGIRSADHRKGETWAAVAERGSSAVSLRAAGRVLLARRWIVLAVIGGPLLICLVYCLIAPKQYESRALLALRTAPATALHMDDAESGSTSSASEQTELETLANVFRSDQLAWRVIVEKKLYAAPGFRGRFAARFPDFRPEAPTLQAQAFLLRRFQNGLRIRTIPRTLLLELRFQSGDPALSADVVNALIHAQEAEQAEERVLATAQATDWLKEQLEGLKTRAAKADGELIAFQKKHSLLVETDNVAKDRSGTVQHDVAIRQVDELGRELAAATSERMIRETQYQAAMQGDPELVLASDVRMQTESGAIATFRQLHTRHSELDQELAQLSLEHGPKFPRVQEIRKELEELERQLQAANAKLRDQYRSAWKTAADRERLVRSHLDDQTRLGLEANEAAIQYEQMRSEADAIRQLYARIQDKAEAARFAAGVHGSDFQIVDAARPPVKPSAPNLPLFLALTLFVALWLAAGAAFALDKSRSSGVPFCLAIAAILLSSTAVSAQAPTPSTSGLPTGVARIPQSQETKVAPNVKEAPPVWSAAAPVSPESPLAPNLAGAFPSPIAPGDLLDISEFHTPQFHTSARVSPAGAVTLPMLGETNVGGMDEVAAAHAIAAALVAQGILLHPQVAVLVIAAAGHDVSVLGEVARPGVYPYGVHHRLFDLLSQAAGLTPAAGRTAQIYRRADPGTPVEVALDFGGDSTPEHNPELQPGDMVRVTRAGLVYVVGDVTRPGGFATDAGRQTTVLQALALAWGPSQNAALKNALLIHEQKGGRTVTTLNLKRMLRGHDPDVPLDERDILFVPDSAAKNLWNRTLESVVQSTAGVSIYAGMVYSQRF